MEKVKKFSHRLNAQNFGIKITFARESPSRTLKFYDRFKKFKHIVQKKHMRYFPEKSMWMWIENFDIVEHNMHLFYKKKKKKKKKTNAFHHMSVRRRGEVMSRSDRIFSRT